MPLTNVLIQPGFNKQVTEVGAEGQWTDGDFVRFRYGLPEKIGGWEQILSSTLVGAAREQFIWADLDGRRYAAIGTNKVLVIYYEGSFYDITPLDTALTGCTFDTVNNDATVTVNKPAHGLEAGDLFTFTSVTQQLILKQIPFKLLLYLIVMNLQLKWLHKQGQRSTEVVLQL